MNWWGQFWQWLTTPTRATLGAFDLTLIGVSLVVAFGGALVAESLAAQRPNIVGRILLRALPQLESAGPGEYGLQTEFLIKVGKGLAASGAALIIALLLRLIGTVGVTTHILPALVLFVVAVMAAYTAFYRLVLFPRYLEQCRRADQRWKYKPATGAAAARGARASKPARQPVDTSSGKTLIGALAAPFIYYLLIVWHPTNEHDLHQLGMVVMAFLGYLVGLVISLGDGWRSGAFWVSARRGEPARRG
ncbi:MAG: hypothetical protein IVW57_12565 [Ktedonobacterales bacterium]|nr:hypothetical protein [Ktedonobacterales bacterium]